MPPMIAVCGIKNSGKTTLITKLLRYLAGKGKKAAVIKHDGHDFSCDLPGTDTSRFTQAGAYGTACFSENRVFVHKLRSSVQRQEAEEDEELEKLAGLFPEADLIIIEGLKGSSLKKIEIVRKGISKEPVSNPEGRLFIVTDIDEPDFAGPYLHPDDIEGIVLKLQAAGLLE